MKNICRQGLKMKMKNYGDHLQYKWDGLMN